MESRLARRTLVSAGVVAVIGVGSVAGAGVSFADSPPVASAASSAVGPAAVVNLGLSIAEAKKLQSQWLVGFGYTGNVDGQLGPQSWKAMQRMLKWDGDGYAGAIDGIVGPGTVRGVQTMLYRSQYYIGNRLYRMYTGPIDGIAGPQTQAAFRKSVDIGW